MFVSLLLIFLLPCVVGVVIVDVVGPWVDVVVVVFVSFSDPKDAEEEDKDIP